MFREIHGNARTMLLFEPMWVVPFSMYSVYTALYMRELGLSPQAIGFIASLGLASYMFCSAFGGYITDRLGRRLATLIFDLLGWSVPMLIWTFAHDFWSFAAAALINGLQAIPATAWSCLLVEDSPPEQRLSIFTVLQMVGPLGGLVAPVAGLIVRLRGVVPGTRLLYFFSFLSMTAMFIGRNHFTRESRVGEARKQATRGHGLRESLRDHGRAIRLLLVNRAAVALLVLNALLAFRDNLIAPFVQLFQVDRLGMSEGTLGVFPAFGSLATLAVLVVCLPRLRGRDERLGLAWGLGLSGLSLAVLVWSPAGSIALVAVSALLGSAGGAVLTPAFNTSWYNTLGDEERAKVVAVSALIWSLVKLPAAYLGGLLYARAATWPFLLSLALLLAGLPLLLLWEAPGSSSPHPLSGKRETGKA